MPDAPLALDIGDALHAGTFVAPVLAVAQLIAFVEMLKHGLVVSETLTAAEERTFAAFLGRHLGTGVALDGSPDKKLVEGTVIV